jgi:ribosome biogenesis ATPase
LDALCPRRGLSENQVTERVVNQLLIELDGLNQRHEIFVVAATNRPGQEFQSFKMHKDDLDF